MLMFGSLVHCRERIEAHLRYRLSIEDHASYEATLAQKYALSDLDQGMGLQVQQVTQSMEGLAISGSSGISSPQPRLEESGELAQSDEVDERAQSSGSVKKTKKKDRQRKGEAREEALVAASSSESVAPKVAPLLLSGGPQVVRHLFSARGLTSNDPFHQQYCQPLNGMHSVLGKKTRFSVTFDELMSMETFSRTQKNFHFIYQNYLSPKQSTVNLSLEEVKLVILMRFTRLLRGLESFVAKQLNGELDDIDIDNNIIEYAALAAEQARVFFTLAEKEQTEKDQLLGPLQAKHGAGESEHLIHATVETLRAIREEMLALESKDYRLPCKLFNLPQAQAESQNAMLLMIINGMNYLTANYFSDFFAIESQKMYSSLNPLNYYYHGRELWHDPKKADAKREHCRGTWSIIFDTLYNTFVGTEDSRKLAFEEGSPLYWEKAIEVIRARKQAAEALRSGKNPERLELSYGKFNAELEHCRRARVKY